MAGECQQEVDETLKDFRQLQDVLEAWTATVRLQRPPGYEAVLQRMQCRRRCRRVEFEKLRRPAARAVRWRIEQTGEFREEVEDCSDAERVILADAYQALLRYGPTAPPSSPLVIHRFRDARAGDAYVVVLPPVLVGYQVLGEVVVVQAADIVRRP
jgi:hypothetical protein